MVNDHFPNLTWILTKQDRFTQFLSILFS